MTKSVLWAIRVTHLWHGEVWKIAKRYQHISKNAINSKCHYVTGPFQTMQMKEYVISSLKRKYANYAKSESYKVLENINQEPPRTTPETFEYTFSLDFKLDLAAVWKPFSYHTFQIIPIKNWKTFQTSTCLISIRFFSKPASICQIFAILFCIQIRIHFRITHMCNLKALP